MQKSLSQTHHMPEALIFDLDGVITQTRDTHKKAWKTLFDLFFEKEQLRQPPLSDEDYQNYIDGKPRYKGIESFLSSRSLSLPYGDPEDLPGFYSICALGNTKNEIFHQVLEQDGVQLYDDAVEKIHHWREEGYKTAIVSSSKNCEKILKLARLEHLFDARVDGLIAEQKGLKGKPDPDIFIDAASLLGVSPDKAVVFEDAISGVQAGQKGYFALVVGVSRFDNGKALLKAGADVTIDNFSEFDLSDDHLLEEYFSTQGTPVLIGNQDIFEKLSQKKPAIFLDYDGTLSPIVAKPEQAILSERMKNKLRELADMFIVAIVTGRDKEIVEELVGLDNVIYAGSHGYIISGPHGLYMEHPETENIVPRLDKIEEELKETLKQTTKGTHLDRKRYAIGIHYRNARPEDEQTVLELADKIIGKYPGHKKGPGKKIMEIKPDLDWHKGKAMLWILDALSLSDRDDVIPVFIGDDKTDEDGFEAVGETGIGILVGGHGMKTAARYALKNVFQVEEFFDRIISLYRNNE
jgi:trehalose 6-phosphate phosphatase